MAEQKGEKAEDSQEARIKSELHEFETALSEAKEESEKIHSELFLEKDQKKISKRFADMKVMCADVFKNLQMEHELLVAEEKKIAKFDIRMVLKKPMLLKLREEQKNLEKKMMYFQALLRHIQSSKSTPEVRDILLNALFSYFADTFDSLPLSLVDMLTEFFRVYYDEFPHESPVLKNAGIIAEKSISYGKESGDKDWENRGTELENVLQSI